MFATDKYSVLTGGALVYARQGLTLPEKRVITALAIHMDITGASTLTPADYVELFGGSPITARQHLASAAKELPGRTITLGDATVSWFVSCSRDKKGLQVQFTPEVFAQYRVTGHFASLRVSRIRRFTRISTWRIAELCRLRASTGVVNIPVAQLYDVLDAAPDAPFAKVAEKALTPAIVELRTISDGVFDIQLKKQKSRKRGAAVTQVQLQFPTDRQKAAKSDAKAQPEPTTKETSDAIAAVESRPDFSASALVTPKSFVFDQGPKSTASLKSGEAAWICEDQIALRGQIQLIVIPPAEGRPETQDEIAARNKLFDRAFAAAATAGDGPVSHEDWLEVATLNIELNRARKRASAAHSKAERAAWDAQFKADREATELANMTSNDAEKTIEPVDQATQDASTVMDKIAEDVSAAFEDYAAHAATPTTETENPEISTFHQELHQAYVRDDEVSFLGHTAVGVARREPGRAETLAEVAARAAVFKHVKRALESANGGPVDHDDWVELMRLAKVLRETIWRANKAIRYPAKA